MSVPESAQLPTEYEVTIDSGVGVGGYRVKGVDVAEAVAAAVRLAMAEGLRPEEQSFTVDCERRSDGT